MQKCLRDAQKLVVSDMTQENDQGLTETMNNSAKGYRTILINNLFMRLQKWQERVLRLELETMDYKKNLHKFLLNAMFRKIVSAEPINQNLYKDQEVKDYKLDSDEICNRLINTHRAQLTGALDLECKNEFVGIFDPKMVGDYPHLYLGYALFLQKRYQQLTSTQNRPKLPFQVIPQLKLKVRCVTFGKRQIAEMVSQTSPEALVQMQELLQDLKYPNQIDKNELAQSNRLTKLEKLRSAQDETPTAKRGLKLSKDEKKYTLEAGKHSARKTGLKRKCLSLSQRTDFTESYGFTLGYRTSPPQAFFSSTSYIKKVERRCYYGRYQCSLALSST